MKQTVKRNRIVWVWGISLLGALVQYALFRPYWETNDDICMGNLAAGALGEASPFLVHPHHFLGILLKFLYGVIPPVSWVGVVWELMVFCSFTAVLWCLWEKAGPYKGTALWLAFFLMFGYAFYTQVNYTRVSCIAAAAGYLLVFQSLENKSLLGTGAGVFLCWTGYMLREESWWLATAMAGGVGLAQLFDGENLHGGLVSLKEIFKKKAPYFLTFGILFLGVLSLYGLENNYANATQERQFFSEFHNIRIRLMDYPVKEYEEIQEELEAVGITKRNYLAFTSQLIHYDPENFTMKAMRTMEALQENTTSGIQGVTEQLSEAFSMAGLSAALQQMAVNRISLNALLCFLLGVILPSRRRWFILVWQLGMLVLMNWYLLSTGRNPERVLESICGMVAMFVLWTAAQIKEKSFRIKIQPNKTWVGLLIVVLLMGTVNASFYLEPSRYGPQQVNWEMIQSEEDLERLAQKDYYYICDVSSDQYMIAQVGLDGLNTQPAGSRSRFIPVGGWTVYHPVYLAQLESAKIQNPYRELFIREDLFLIDQYQTGNTFQYIENTYPEEMAAARWSVCDTIGEGSYLLAFSPQLEPVEGGTQVAALDIRKKEKQQDENLIWIAGSWDGMGEEQTYYLRLVNQQGDSATYRILPELAEKGMVFQVGIAAQDLNQDIAKVQVLQGREQPLLVAETLWALD